MLSSRYRPWHVPIFLSKYFWLRARRRPVSLNFEVTMRCNARCGFCDYWKTPADAKDAEIAEFGAIARHFSPMLVTFTGGEPTLRKDLEQIVASVRKSVRFTYVQLITHGGMLSLERALSLWNAGVDQFNISLDYLDERHDQARGIPGLTERILALVPRMRDAGIGGVRFNTVIKHDNIDQLMPIVERAAALGGGVNFSVYTDFKNGNRDHLLGADDSRGAGTGRRGAARSQASSPRRDHELRLLPRADPAVRARRNARALSERHHDRAYRSARHDPAVSGLPGRWAMAGLSWLRANCVQRVLLCLSRRGAGAAASDVARARRDGVDRRSETTLRYPACSSDEFSLRDSGPRHDHAQRRQQDHAVRQRLADADGSRAGARSARRGDARCRRARRRWRGRSRRQDHCRRRR